MEKADLTTGPIRSQLWKLAWPMMLSVFFYTLYNIVDAYWVSKVSPEAIAAVSISQISLFLMISVGFGITAGSGVIMAMDIGAKNTKEAERVLGQSFVLMAITGAVFTLLSLMFRAQLLTVSGAAGAIFDPAMEYFTVTAGGSILFFILTAIMFAFNAQGDTFTLTKLFAVSTLVNVILDPMLIFGWGGLPELGVAGAAYATLISQAVFICIALYALSRPSRDIQFHIRNLSFNWTSVKQVLKIGIPAAMTQVLQPVGMAALTFLSSYSYQEAGAVAFSLGFRVEFFAYLPAVGYGFGGMAMIGQNIGARNLARAKEVLSTALRYGAGIAVLFGLVVAAFAPQVIGIFTEDPLVMQYALGYMRIVALSYGFLAAMMVSAMAFQAMGHSWPGFWIMFVRFMVIALPVSYILAIVLGWSINALWIALVAGNVIAAILGYVWVRRAMARFNLHEIDETVETHG